MDQFLDTIELSISDEEHWDQDMKFFTTVTVSGEIRRVSAAVIATFPDSVALSPFIRDRPKSTILDGDAVIGDVVYTDTHAFLLLRKDVRFNLAQVVLADSVVVLISARSGIDHLSALSERFPTNIQQKQLAIGGVAADQLTQSMIQNKSCLVLVNEHTSISVELDGLVALAQELTHVLGLPNPDVESLTKEFKRQVPINKKFPLYT